MSDRLYGSVEAGGTKFVCMVASGPENILSRERIDTRTPQETLPEVIEFFREQVQQHGPLAGLGIGSFGPVDPDRESPTFGHITKTPKPHWSHTDLAGPLRDALGVDVAFDTDVNAAALGEHRWGAARGLHTFVYLTVGTGIGGGGMIGGKLMHGLVHPEMGHIRLPRDPQRDPFTGTCPFHGDCLEGLACGPAIHERWGAPGGELPDDHPAWELEAEYLALALNNFICTLSPQRIILGGGVMDQPRLLPLVRQRVLELLNNYVVAPAITQQIEQYIVAPGLGNNAGGLGALALAGAGDR